MIKVVVDEWSEVGDKMMTCVMGVGLMGGKRWVVDAKCHGRRSGSGSGRRRRRGGCVDVRAPAIGGTRAAAVCCGDARAV